MTEASIERSFGGSPQAPADPDGEPDLSPRGAPLLYQSIALGNLVFPALPDSGVATIEITQEIKVDEKEAQGKDDAKVTIKGLKPSDIKVHLQWFNRIDKQTMDFLREISPRNKKNSGKPFQLVHPDAKSASISDVIVKKIGPIKREPGTNSCDLEMVSWIKKPTGSGSKTPTDPMQWSGSGSTTRIGSNGNRVGGFADDPPTKKIGSNNNQVGGMDNGPNKPVAKP